MKNHQNHQKSLKIIENHQQSLKIIKNHQNVNKSSQINEI